MTEAQAAHLRLISSLPVRTHERAWGVERDKSNGAAKPIHVQGKRYDSFRQAFKALRISPLTLARWLREGKAVYE